MSELAKHFDAIVIGARVAGSAAAILIARQGRRVLLLDKDGAVNGWFYSKSHMAFAVLPKAIERSFINGTMSRSRSRPAME